MKGKHAITSSRGLRVIFARSRGIAGRRENCWVAAGFVFESLFYGFFSKIKQPRKRRVLGRSIPNFSFKVNIKDLENTYKATKMHWEQCSRSMHVLT